MKPFAEIMKHVPDLSMPDQPVRPGVAWTMRHLRPGFIATAVLLVVGGVIAYPLAGWRGVLGVCVGLLIVALFFAISTWAVVLAGARDDRLTLPAALLAFGVKVIILGALLTFLPDDGPIDVTAMAWAVLVGVLVWLASQIMFVLRTPTYYVDYHPPAGADDD